MLIMSSMGSTRVQLLVTCLADAVYPAVGEAVVAVLERLGVTVEFPPEQTCCGQPAYNAGFRREARQMALHCLEVFERSPAPIVVPSGSCAAMLRQGYAELFAGEFANRARAQRLAARTYEFAEFLVEQLGVADVGARWHGSVTYHASCHLTRALGIRQPPLKLLSSVRELEFTPLPEAEECCGFGGIFAVKHPDISTAILERKLANIYATRARYVTGCDLGCLMNIQGALSREGSAVRCVHLAEILAAR